VITVYTAGHSVRPAAELIVLLAEADVRRLVDIRRYPVSRRHPQFSRDRLEATLHDAGIAYRHEPRLGGHRETTADSPNLAWSEALRGYADHMASGEFQQAVDELLAEAATTALAVMCAEADPKNCHRQLLADALVAREARVVHLIRPGERREHERHPAARVEDGGRRITYPVPVRQKKLF
jgi:uncharacterized protein (DUF488 family)